MICIYHSRDLDGWCSAAIVKKWFIENNSDGIVYGNPYIGDKSIISGKKIENSLTLFGWDYGDEIPNLSSYSKVVMVDISFPPDVMKEISKTKSLTWIDHHISAIKANEEITNSDRPQVDGWRSPKYAACELTWMHYFSHTPCIPEFVRLLGRYDCFGHKGTEEERAVLEFQYAARASYKNVDDCYNYLREWDSHDFEANDAFKSSMIDKGKAIYSYLCTEAEQDYNTRFTVDFDGYKFACINKKRFNPINFGINYHNDRADDILYYDGVACFHYENGYWNFSLYNDNGSVDCSEICKRRGGGGHKGAAGFRVKDILSIIDR